MYADPLPKALALAGPKRSRPSLAPSSLGPSLELYAFREGEDISTVLG